MISHSPVGWHQLVHMVTSGVWEPEQSMQALEAEARPWYTATPTVFSWHGKSQVQQD